jgi:hypothetical protein
VVAGGLCGRVKDFRQWVAEGRELAEKTGSLKWFKVLKPFLTKIR